MNSLSLADSGEVTCEVSIQYQDELQDAETTSSATCICAGQEGEDLICTATPTCSTVLTLSPWPIWFHNVVLLVGLVLLASLLHETVNITHMRGREVEGQRGREVEGQRGEKRSLASLSQQRQAELWKMQ